MHRSLRIGGSSATDSNSLLALRSRPYDGKIAGLYDLEETLGRGHFAVVKLARHVFTGEKVAVKVIDKSKLDEVSKAHLFQEVRCMKLVQHPHVVRLYEVIDTATKLYLILELGDGGDLYEYILRHDTGLPEEVAREYFSQIVRAISYCHQLHVVHRDLKPENVVFFKKLGIVKLTDFGFSNKFYPGQKLETSCGSLAYSAPEILLGDSYDAPAVDVWSLGVILYMLVCGQPPFQEANDSETLTMIMDCKYIVPPHVSEECRDLIARMLVRNPEKRATLKEISNHKWLSLGKEDANADTLTVPLVSREHLCEEDHNFIVQKIVNGNIATKEEIQECLDKNEYNHITATYFLLAERKLRSKRQDQTKNSNKRPEHLAVKNSTPKKENNGSILPAPCLLNIPRTPGDLPQRSRKCSIVQEDEEEEDISSCSGREDLGSQFSRRGSRSEGRLNLALQERLAELERRKPSEKLLKNDKISDKLLATKTKENSIKWENNNINVSEPAPVPVTTIITESSTISIPIITTNSPSDPAGFPKYKTMPSPTRNNTLPLNEIFEEGENSHGERQPLSSSRHFVKRTPYEQRKSKFHKTRTASCSSSDASDDDSEKRKKRAHKLSTTPTKPIKGRRDSYDDSSDSQEPGTGASGGTAQRLGGNSTATLQTNSGGTGTQESKNGGSTGGGNSGSNNTNSGGRKNNSNMLGRRHKASRRRNGETRLRESQSLNRITEVQEDGAHTLVISTTVVGTHGTLTPKVKGLGARILQGFSISMKKSHNNPPCSETEKTSHISRKDTLIKSPDTEEPKKDKKLKILGKYFYVRKKLCIPLPGLFGKNRLYKAQSCGSLARDKINKNDVLHCRQRAVSVFRNSIASESDIDQNKNKRKSGGGTNTSATVVQLNDVCNELTGICAIHLGQTSKCSFC